MPDNLTNEINKVNQFLTNKGLFFFSRDVERGFGLENIISTRHLMHIEESQYIPYLKDSGIKYFCLEEMEGINNIEGGARKILQNNNAKKYLEENKRDINFSQTFKISPSFERLSESVGFRTVNTTSDLNRKYEDKISQFEVLQNKIKFPKTILGSLDQYTFLQLVQALGDRFIIQFPRSHTGSGTYIISSESVYEKVKSEHGQRKVKISSFIDGITYTLNGCITKNGIYLAGLSLQITGAKELTLNEGGTVGNDWSRRTNIENLSELITQSLELAKDMASSGFRGLFGVDFIAKDTGEIFIIEINARQTASIPTHSRIQLLKGEIPLPLLNLMDIFEIPIQIDPAEYSERNLKPDNYSQIYIRADRKMTIAHQVDMGNYRLQGDNAAINRLTDEIESTTIFLDEDRDKAFLYQKYATHLGEMDRQSILVLTPIGGRILNQGDEVARLQINQSAVNDQGLVYPWIVEALIAIKTHQL